jgi:anti-anti-sigma factor
VANDEPQHPAPRLELASRRAGQSLELAITGELDMEATFRLEPELDRLLDEPDLRRLECDLAGVSFVDSAGLGLLLALNERAQDRGIAFTVLRVSAPVRRILDMSGIGAVLTEDDASSRRGMGEHEVGDAHGARAEADTGQSVSPAGDEQVLELLHELLRRSHMSTPSDLAFVVADQARGIGASDVVIYLIDYEQGALVQVPGGAAGRGEPLSVGGTVAGRAFSSTSILRSKGDVPGLERLFLPLLDGTERVGVIGMSFEEGALSERLIAACERYAHLVAVLIVTKNAYGDAFEVIRRRQPMTIASELLWALAPPLVFATDGLTLAGMLEPCYDNGGDALDYAVDDRVLHVAVFDAMGHGLAAAGVAAFALSAYRWSRRSGSDLLETYAAMHEAVGTQFPDRRFVTALIAQLELDSGRLRWISAGHPPPLVIRSGHARTLTTTPVPPLGVESPRGAPPVATDSLEPGDLLLLYTDGLSEARDSNGEMFTIERLAEFIEREAAAGQTAPETLRRLRHAVIGREATELRDDATALLLEWQSGRETDLMPQTV